MDEQDDKDENSILININSPRNKLCYISSKQSEEGNQFVCHMSIKNNLLIALRDRHQAQNNKLNYVELLDVCIPDKIFALKSSSERLLGRIAAEVTRAKTQMKKFNSVVLKSRERYF